MTRQIQTLVLVGFALLVGSCAHERAGGKSSSGMARNLASGNYYCSSPPQLLDSTAYQTQQACLDNLHAACTAFCNSNPQWFFVPATGEGCAYYSIGDGGYFGYCVCQIDCVDKAACPQFPNMCLTNTCSGNNVVLNAENQPCGEFCTGWGVHYCFILDGAFVPCDYYGQNACMCGETVGITQGCKPPDGESASAKWPRALPPPQKQ